MSDYLPPSPENLMIRTIAMPKDTNPIGDIFGGWLLSQMDLAGSNAAMKRSGTRVVTVAIKAIEFHHPVYVGDEVSCYAKIMRIGRTSLMVQVSTWVCRKGTGDSVKVTEGIFTFVAMGEDNRPHPVPSLDKI